MLSALNHFTILLFVLKAVTGYTFIIYLASIFGIVIFISQLIRIRQIEYDVLILIIFSFIGYIFSIVISFDGFLFFPQFIACIGIAWVIHTHGLNKYIFTILFYGLSVYFFILVFLGIPTYEAFAYSNNYISVNFINCCILLYIARTQDSTIKLMPAIICFLISILGLGFGGILSSALLLILLFSFKLNLSFFGKFLLIVLFFFTIHILFNFSLYLSFIIEEFRSLLLYFNGNDLIVKLENIINFSYDYGSRTVIWSDYLSKLNFMSFIFGSNLNSTFSIAKDALSVGNIHSSFLLMHQRLGFISLIFFIYILVGLVKNFKISYLSFIFLLVILLRGFTDTTFFAASNYDFILIYLFLYAFKDKKMKLNVV